MGENKQEDHELSELMNAHFSMNEIDAILLPYIEENPMLPRELVESLVLEEENPLKLEDDQPEYRFIKPASKRTRKEEDERSEKDDIETDSDRLKIWKRDLLSLMATSRRLFYDIEITVNNHKISKREGYVNNISSVGAASMKASRRLFSLMEV